MKSSNKSLLKKLLERWDYDAAPELAINFISTIQDFDISDKKYRKKLKKFVRSRARDLQLHFDTSENLAPPKSESIKNQRWAKYLSRWGSLGSETQYATSLNSLDQNTSFDSKEGNNSRTFRISLRSKAEETDQAIVKSIAEHVVDQSITEQVKEVTREVDVDQALEMLKRRRRFRNSSTSESVLEHDDQELEISKRRGRFRKRSKSRAVIENEDLELTEESVVRKAISPPVKESVTEIDVDQELETPKDRGRFQNSSRSRVVVDQEIQEIPVLGVTDTVLEQAAVSIFGTSIDSNNLGDFFPEDGKVSSRMEKLFARLIEIVQDKPFYVDYGDYTDPNTLIKDAVVVDGEFVFDASGSREFRGGRVSGKGLNVEDPNYQGISSEDWAKSDSSLIRLSDGEWGKVIIDGELVEQVGRPKGYQGEFYGVNNVSSFIDSYDSLTNSKSGELTNTRKISNIIGIDEVSPVNDNALNYSSLHMAFGQYTDHNMSFLARTSTGQGLVSQVDPFDLPESPFPGFGPPSFGGSDLQEGESDTLNLNFTQQPLNSFRNNFGQLVVGKRKVLIPTGSVFSTATIKNALNPEETIFIGGSDSEFITINAESIELNVFGLLEELKEQGLTPEGDITFAFEGSTPSVKVNIIPETGIIGNRGELYLVRDGKLVTVAYFDEENNNGKSAGFYEFDVTTTVGGDVVVTSKGEEPLLTNEANNRNKIVHRNRTEAMIQNNQLYGATDLQNYYLRESARYTEEEDGFVVYHDEIGNVYRTEKDEEKGVVVGSIVRGSVQKNGKDFEIKNFKISTGVDSDGNQLRAQLFVDANAGIPADILKTSHMLSSAAIGTDGLQSLPTYSDLLLNNGVDSSLLKNILSANSNEQYFIGRFGPNPLWLALESDKNFIDFNNVEGYPIIGDISPRVFASSRTSGAMRGLDQNDDNIADAFALLKYENDNARVSDSSVRKLIVRDFDGNEVTLSENLQPKINSEDWGMGLLLSHVVGGDWRANENAGLATFHTLWAREHSFHVDWINSTIISFKNNREEKAEFNENYNLDLDTVTTDDVANMARRMVEMEYQKILYEQFAPSLVGDIAKIGDHGWDGFNPMVDASVAEEFSNGAYRYGHSQIQELLIPGGELFDLFLAPQYTQAYGFSGIINGMSQITAAEVDTKVSESVRSNLLANKLDLKSANINRTRETGQANAQQLLKSLSGYDIVEGEYIFQVDESGMMKEGFAPLNLKNGSDVTRGILGPDGLFGTDDDTPGLDYGFVGNESLKPFLHWEDFASRLRGDNTVERNTLLAGFMAVYDDTLAGDTVEERLISAEVRIAGEEPLGSSGLDQVDVWNFMLAEKPSGDHLLGDLASAIVWEQLDRFQDGDAAYYLNSLDGLGGGVWNHTLSPLEDIIARNSSLSTSDNYLDSGFSEDVFKTTPVQADLTDAITGIYPVEQPFDPNSINNVDYLSAFLPSEGEARSNNTIDLDNPYVLQANDSIYERVGANFQNIPTLWEQSPVDPWLDNNIFSHNTSASIDHADLGQGTFTAL